MHIAITSWQAYPLVDPRDGRPVGGAETRAVTFARALAARGEAAVHLAVRAPGLFRHRVVQGLHVWNLGDGLDGLRWKWHHERFLPSLPLLLVARGMRLVLPDERRLQRVYRRIPADVHLTFGVNSASWQAIEAAQAQRVPAVLFIAAQSELDPRLAAGENFRTLYREDAQLCRDVLAAADAIFVQTPGQQRQLKQLFSRDSTVIANPIDLEEWDRLAADVESARALPPLPDGFALWIGRAESVEKRPLVAFEVARMCPELPFVMIVNPADSAVEAQLERECPANVTLIRRLPFRSMPALYQRAAVVFSTSAAEGFPNTFLQAAASGVPIGSLDVGEEWLAASGAGLHASGDMQRLAQEIQRLASDTSSAKAIGRQGRRYVETEHAAPQQAARLFEALQAVCQEHRAGRDASSS